MSHVFFFSYINYTYSYTSYIIYHTHVISTETAFLSHNYYRITIAMGVFHHRSSRSLEGALLASLGVGGSGSSSTGSSAGDHWLCVPLCHPKISPYKISPYIMAHIKHGTMIYHWLIICHVPSNSLIYHDLSLISPYEISYYGWVYNTSIYPSPSFGWSSAQSTNHGGLRKPSGRGDQLQCFEGLQAENALDLLVFFSPKIVLEWME